MLGIIAYRISCSCFAGQLFLKLFREAALISVRRNELHWLLRPKMHTFDEMLLTILLERVNPRSYHCFAEEDFLGLVKPLAIKSVLSGKAFERNMLRRYMTRPAIDNRSFEPIL